MNRLKTSSLIIIFICLAGICSGKEKLRVVSMSPNLTEIICKLGKEDCLVGRSSACDYPVSVKNLPSCGDFGIPSLEQMARLKPDILVSASLKDRGIIENIEKFGIKVYLFHQNSLEDYFDSVKKIGDILHCPDAAEKEIKSFKAGLKELAAKTTKIAPEKRPSVFFVIHDTPAMTVGNKSYLNVIVELSGGRNIAADVNNSYFNCSLEWVMRQKPDVVILPTCSESKAVALLASPGWRSLPAVKNKKVYFKYNQDELYRLGPRLLNGIRFLYKCFYPEKSKDADEAQVK